MAEALSMADIRAQQVLARDRVSFDYEKVFWRTLYGVGLFGVGAITVKMGTWLGNIKSIDEAVADFNSLGSAATEISEDTFWRIYDDVEAKRTGGSVGIAAMISYYVYHPEDWETLKIKYVPGYTEQAEDDPPILVQKPKVQMIVEGMDRLMYDYGPVVPVGIFLFGLASEYSRTRRMKGALK